MKAAIVSELRYCDPEHKGDCMDATTLALVNSGATTLLGLMVTDAWGKAKGLAVRLFSRDSLKQQYVEAELEEAREALLAALESGDATAEGEIEAEWRARLRRAVEKDPLILASLREFVAQNDEAASGFRGTVRSINMRANARGHGRVYQQGQGVQHN